jgi:hypothetical protein
LVALGAVVRFWGLGANRLGYDESFTAMAGRLPLGSLFSYLRANDSHPPLDYLLRAPLARLGVDEFVFRTPSVLCSVGALALFAYWMRSRGRVGVLATALMAVSAFQILHGRNARMYAELELLGVALAVLTEAWLRAPRRRHAPILAVFVFAGLLLHVSMILFAFGLFVLPGRRTDRDAWRWRAAIAGAGAVWAGLWGSSFLVQSAGGHSDWIPRTNTAGVVDTVSSLATGQTAVALVVFAGVAVGGYRLWRTAPRLGVVWVACFAVPFGLAVLLGFVAPVLLDRTLTLGAWAPLLALAALLDWLLSGSARLGVAALVLLSVIMLPASLGVITSRSGPTGALRRLESVAQSGDVVAVRSARKVPELEWSLGVRGSEPWRPVAVPGIPKVAGLALGSGAPTGRVWVLDWNSRLRTADGYERCAPDWNFGVSRILCLRNVEPARASPAPEPPDQLSIGRQLGTRTSAASLH